jgi:hypothetical protein
VLATPHVRVAEVRVAVGEGAVAAMLCFLLPLMSNAVGIVARRRLVLPDAGSWRLGRRGVLRTSAAAAVAALVPPLPALSELASGPLPVQQLSINEIETLLATASRDPGTLLPNGVRVFDLVVGEGLQPVRGGRVWASFKCWANGFDAGQVADLSFLDGRPYSWVLGQPTERIPKGVDEAVAGMREGGWRRMAVPAEAGYGDRGLRKTGRAPAPGGYITTRTDKAGYAVRPGEPVYFDVRLIDGGSGRCTELLRPVGPAC